MTTSNSDTLKARKIVGNISELETKCEKHDFQQVPFAGAFCSAILHMG